ncbi:cytochrome P450 [Halorussus lipolyticus]|uniref:cytochrome P450 n=1 Tax=Halorussus lipolyticus TaxID=3034024 RepID=UPI0023E83494|nr:cytochrome P450 [Halorussus sp. DT80]
MSSIDTQKVKAFPEELKDPEAWLEPFDWYREMRDENPVRYDEDRQSWDVFRYDDVKAILDDDGNFSVDPSNADYYDASASQGPELLQSTMLFQDPPRHDELRSVVDDAFKPQNVRELEPRLNELADDLLDQILAESDGEMDIVTSLAYPYPVITIAEHLGIPSDERAQFKQWSNTIVETARTDDEQSEIAENQQQKNQEMAQYFLRLINQRRENPQDDLLSTIATAESDDGTRLSDEEALGMCVLLLVAGNVTTTNLITNAIRCFGNHDLFGELRGDDDALMSAIDEALRYRSPVQTMARFATDDVTMHGKTIEEGDRVQLWLGSANRDERKFEDADTFKPDRTPNQHLGFGSGTHYCLGSSLARLEAKTVLSKLLDRLESVELVETDLTPTRSTFVYGVESLPVRFEQA